ncbi:MAG: ComEA family DNA-binding protein [Planctomycetota bacterium]|jgi:competence ComEA-like helix-hairpin-helix protein
MNRDRQNSIQSFAFVIGVCAAVCLCGGFVAYPGADESTSGQREIELESRINPNVAPVESLVRLPGLGIVRAGAIVAYRESYNQANEANPAFQNCDDLQKISGIGPKTVQNMSEWMKFE